MAVIESHIPILLNKEAVASARELSRAAQEPYKESPGFYGDNSIEKHFTGKLGELAVSHLFQKANLKVKEDFAILDRQSRTDLKVKIDRSWVSIEVKTFSENRWPEHGRVVSELQKKNISQNSDFVFWCSVTLNDGEQTASVRIRGYSPVADLCNQSLHSDAYKLETIQLQESSLRHPRQFAADVKILYNARRELIQAERRSRIAAERQRREATQSGGKYLEMLRRTRR